MTAGSGEGPVERISRLAFYVVGKPITQGSKKAYKVGNSIRIVEANEDQLQDWRGSIVSAARKAMGGREGFARDAEVGLYVTFYLHKGVSVRRRRPTVAPDLSKLVRAIEDAMTIAGVYGDDSQIVSMWPEKKYADREHPVGAEVLVVELA